MCSRLSNQYSETSRACCVIGVHGYLTPIIPTALPTTLTCSPLPLSLYGNGHCMCSWLSNPYNETSRACCVIGVHGYLTPIMPTALPTTLTCSPLPLSLYGNGHCMCSRLSNPYNETSRTCCVIGVHGYLTPIIPTPLPTTLTHSSFSLSCLGPGRHEHVWGYDGWKVIIAGIHSQLCSIYIFVAQGSNIYLALGIMTCLAIGLWVWKLDSNCCTFLLSPTAPPPRTKVIGKSVARFARPFESRPTDPIRREVYRQLAAHPVTASTSGWVPPASLLPATPLPLQNRVKESSSRPVPPKAKGARRRYNTRSPTYGPKKLEIYLRFPYLSNKLNYYLQNKLRNIVHKYYPQIQLTLAFYNNNKIRNYCNHKDKLESKNLSMVVYMFICPSCHLLYIGSTIKTLEQRVFEHFGSSFRTRRPLTCPVQSSIRDHCHSICECNFTIKDFCILYRGNYKEEIRIAESLFIKRLDPSLNLDTSSVPLRIE